MSEHVGDAGLRPGRLSLVLVNHRREIPRLAAEVERFGLACGLTEDDTSRVNLALDELVSNIIRYGHDDQLEHRIHVDLSVEGDELTVVVEDDGKPFNPLEVPPPDLDAPIEERGIGGLGVFLVRSVADSLDYRRHQHRNVLTLRRRMERA